MSHVIVLKPLLIEIFVCLSALIILIIGVFRQDDEKNGSLCSLIAICVLTSLTLFLVFTEPNRSLPNIELFQTIFINDAFSRFTKILILFSASISLGMGLGYFKRASILRFEIPVIVLLSVAGMLFMVSSTDLIAVYLSLELMSLPLYVLSSIRRDYAPSTEAGLKYFVLGALSSGLYLYGASLIYGICGSTSFEVIQSYLSGQNGQNNIIFTFGLVFLLAAFAFKISAVPFHMWTPDVYQGSPTPITAFFSSAPKVAAISLLLRLLVQPFGKDISQWQQIIVFLSILSMVVGTFAAIGQTNIKRLFAYSTISHVGFSLMGLVVGTEQAVSAILIYLAIYITMSLGAFACVLAMRVENGTCEEIDSLSGISENNLTFALVFGILLFSLAGIPPLAGFFAKFYILDAVIRGGFTWLALFGIIMSVIGSFYYLRIIKIMFFDPNSQIFKPTDLAVRVVMFSFASLNLLYVVYPASLIDAGLEASRSLFH